MELQLQEHFRLVHTLALLSSEAQGSQYWTTLRDAEGRCCLSQMLLQARLSRFLVGVSTGAFSTSAKV